MVAADKKAIRRGQMVETMPVMAVAMVAIADPFVFLVVVLEVMLEMAAVALHTILLDKMVVVGLALLVALHPRLLDQWVAAAAV
jgi:small neutral amino acid transporter SnatA (MarC family)